MTTASNTQLITAPMKQYSPKEKVQIAGMEMVFSHWITHNGKQLPFFHYYVNGEEFGYINHSLAQEI